MLDPYYNNVSLLLPMSGANNGTIFTDYSASPKIVTRYNAVTTTANSKYYGSSGYFDGVEDYLTIPHSDAMNLYIGDWCIQAWVNLTSQIDSGTLYAKSNPSNQNGMRIHYHKDNILLLIRNSTNTSWLINLMGAKPIEVDNTWAHIAVTKALNTYRIFLNGFNIAETTNSNATYNSSELVTIGKLPGLGQVLNGFVNDYEITKGQARYTTNFTPPPRKVPYISGIIRDITDAPCARKVYIYNRANGALLGSQTSDAVTGQYEIMAHPSVEEVSRLVIADEPGLYNDLIDRVLPE